MGTSGYFGRYAACTKSRKLNKCASVASKPRDCFNHLALPFPVISTMVYYFTSSITDPPTTIYVGKDKFESPFLPSPRPTIPPS